MSVLLNITYEGQSGNYLADIDANASDAYLRRVSEELVRSGDVPGVSSRIRGGAFANFVVDRFQNEGQTRIVLRPKVPFGA